MSQSHIYRGLKSVRKKLVKLFKSNKELDNRYFLGDLVYSRHYIAIDEISDLETRFALFAYDINTLFYRVLSGGNQLFYDKGAIDAYKVLEAALLASVL